MSNKFTPGPWHVDGHHTTAVIAEVEPNLHYNHVCTCDYGYTNPGAHLELNQANARLIAAAPEMYELLKNAMHVINSYFPHLDGCTQDDEDLYLSAANQIESLLNRIDHEQ
jgi:hypothetical protein